MQHSKVIALARKAGKTKVDGILRRHYPNTCKKALVKYPELPFTEAVYRYAFGPKNCLSCKSPTKFLSFTNGYQPFCGRACALTSEERQESRRKTTQARYGVDCVMSLTSVRKTSKRTMLRRYGVDNPSKSRAIQAKKTQSNLAKYGVENISQRPEVKAKRDATFMRRYGMKSFLCSTLLKEKGMLYTHGVRNPLQDSNIRRKAFESAKKLTPIKCGGKTFLCQGYEKQVLPRLVRKFGVNNVIGQFEEGFKPLKFKNRVYTPDFYIRSNDTYVEVKSTFTLYGKIGVSNFLQQNRSLQEQASNRGIKLKFIVYSEVKDKCTVLPSTWHSMSRSSLKQNLA